MFLFSWLNFASIRPISEPSSSWIIDHNNIFCVLTNYLYLRKSTASKSPFSMCCIIIFIHTQMAGHSGTPTLCTICMIWKFIWRTPFVTCYHKMSVKSPVCIQRYSLLNIPQNKRKQRKIITKYWFLLDKTKSYTHMMVVVVLRSPIHANEPSEYNGMLYRTSNRVLNNGIKVIILICMDGTSQYHHHPHDIYHFKACIMKNLNL